MAFLLPGLIISEALVRKARQTKSGVANANCLSFIGHDFGSDVD